MHSRSYTTFTTTPYIHCLLSGGRRGRLAALPLLGGVFGGRVVHHPGIHLYTKVVQERSDVLQDLVDRLTALLRGPTLGEAPTPLRGTTMAGPTRGVAPRRAPRRITLVGVATSPLATPSATSPPPMPPPKTGLRLLHGNHVVLCVPALGLTRRAEVKVHARETLEASAKDVAFASVAHHTVVVRTLSASSIVAVLLVAVPCLLLLSRLWGSRLWLGLLLWYVQGMDAEQLVSSTLQAQGKLLIAGDQDSVTIFVCMRQTQEKERICNTRAQADLRRLPQLAPVLTGPV